MKKRNAFVALAALSAGAVGQLTVFEQFAVAASFDATAWQDFVATEKTNQMNTTQKLIQNRHTDDTNHNNHTNHSNSSPHGQYTQHSDGSAHNDYSDHDDHAQHSNNTTHSNSPHNNVTNHTNNTPHINNHTNSHAQSDGAHYDYILSGGHQNAYTHHNGSYYQGHFNETDPSGGVHNNGYAHNNKYNQNHNNGAGAHTDDPRHTDTHSDTSNHTDTSPHSHSAPHINNWNGHSDSNPHSNHSQHNNSAPHANGDVHSNTGFDHDNYVPSAPALFNVTQDRIVGGMLKIGVFSYDKNVDGAGSQDALSKTVRYDVMIRKVKNANGAANVSAWRNLATDQTDSAGVGLLVDLNTLDPLGTGNTNPANSDGYYEVRTVARNAAMNGVSFQSQEKVVTIQIRQNASPEITVTNGSEFINFTFGFSGALTTAGTLKSYTDGLYADSDQDDGLYVRIAMVDADNATDTAQNWQKGRIYLKNAAGAIIANTTIDLTWSDTGTTVTSSSGQTRTGYAFIPKSAFTGADLVNAKVFIEVTDYKDAACTQAAGTTVTQSTVSKSNSTDLTINVDVTKPVVTATNTDYNWKTAIITAGLSFTDAVSGFGVREYALTTSPVQPTTGWTAYSSPITMATDGQYYLWYHAKDKMGQEQYGYFGPYRLDRTAPVMTATQTEIAGSDNIRIDVSLTDSLSGPKRIQLPNGVWVNGDAATYTATTAGIYRFVGEDQVGNISTLDVVVEDNPIIYDMTLVSMAGGIQAGTTLPAPLPMTAPLLAKTGYRMTMRVSLRNSDLVELKFYANGQPISVYDGNGAASSVIVATGSRSLTSVDVDFWFDKTLPAGTVIDMKVYASKRKADGTLKTTVNSSFGYQLLQISGSATQDASINLTH